MNSERTKTIIKIALWIVVAVLGVAAVATIVLFVALNSDMKSHREFANQFIEEGMVDAENQMLTQPGD